ncbi:hypothetical protein Gotur_015814 [Gossypium turneri]
MKVEVNKDAMMEATMKANQRHPDADNKSCNVEAIIKPMMM